VTIRDGGSPRGDFGDPDVDQAHPLDDDVDWTPIAPRDRRDPRRGNGRNRGGGLAGLLRFLVFALVMATVVMVTLLTLLRPVLAGAIVGWAYDSPSALALPFVKDLVKEDLGTKLTTAPSTDPATVEFVVNQGETAATIATRLASDGFLLDARAFVFMAIDQNLADKLESGTFILRKNMTPDDLVQALLKAKDLAVDLPFREGLRLEQIVAKLETLPVKMDPTDFYTLAKHPTPAILAAHPWLQLPKGASLEGFLAPAVYHVLPDITAEELIDKMLDVFYRQVGPELINVPKSRGMTFYQIVTLASLVEREARLDKERPLIAGVFQNRLNPKLFPLGEFQSDVTIFYIHDSIQLATIPVSQWVQYAFWGPVDGKLTGVAIPAALRGYDTYSSKGLMPGPICTPSLASIDAALAPDTKTGYLFFVAKNDGSNTTAFAKTQAEHDKNVKKYAQ
jgi:UPF0755 protein